MNQTFRLRQHFKVLTNRQIKLPREVFDSILRWEIGNMVEYTLDPLNNSVTMRNLTQIQGEENGGNEEDED